MSEHIAVLFLAIGNNFNVIAARIIQKYTGINLEEELTGKKSKSDDTSENQNTNTSDTK